MRNYLPSVHSWRQKRHLNAVVFKNRRLPQTPLPGERVFEQHRQAATLCTCWVLHRYLGASQIFPGSRASAKTQNVGHPENVILINKPEDVLISLASGLIKLK